MMQRWGLPVVVWPARWRPNSWDLLALSLVLGGIALIAWGSDGINAPYQVGEPIALSLDPANLPHHALRTVLRMAAALLASLLFSLAYAALAAKSRQAEKLLIPLLDVLQSVPILGFLSITVTGFIALFPGSLLGVECASIFAIFTSQAWNMTFSLYQSFRTVPIDLVEAAAVYQLSPWRRFWRLEVPFAMPALVWNMMMSASGGWFFVVASEAITVSGQTVMLPGIGSYIALAIQDRDLAAIGYAIITMLVVILAYDQVVFRPLLAWSDTFRSDQEPGEPPREAWLLTMIQRVRFFRALSALPGRAADALGGILRRAVPRHGGPPLWLGAVPAEWRRWMVQAWNLVLIGSGLSGVYAVRQFVATEVGLAEVGQVFLLGLYTLIRVAVLIGLASVIWIPIGVAIGLRPRLAQRVQPIVQFLAAFPANLVFPIAVMLIVHYRLDVEIWVSPLMIFGTQWYILFNVIAGVSTIPAELKYASELFGVHGWLWWRRVMLPAILPAYVTGAVTASGGSWNASIVAEVVRWGDTTLTASGIGAYITQSTEAGDMPRVALGIAVLCLFVTALNRLLWRRLYAYAEERVRLN